MASSLTHHFTAYCSHHFAALPPECCCARSISLFNFDSKVLLATLPYQPLGSSDFSLPYPYSIILDPTARTAHKLAVHGTDDVRRMHAQDLISIPSRPSVALPLPHHIALPLSHLYAIPLFHLYALPLPHLYTLPLSHIYALPLSHLYALPLSHLVALPFLVPSPSTSLTLSPRPPFPPVALPFSSPSVQIAFAICSPIPLPSCFPSPSIQIAFAICSPIPSPFRFPSPPRSHLPSPHDVCPPFGTREESSRSHFPSHHGRSPPLALTIPLREGRLPFPSPSPRSPFSLPHFLSFYSSLPCPPMAFHFVASAPFLSLPSPSFSSFASPCPSGFSSIPRCCCLTGPKSKAAHC
ncbi:unnamed protein product [Closterium sp. Yama58-4]|nr:unnamed protein product [Closterium sp. Yama58-4]